MADDSTTKPATEDKVEETKPVEPAVVPVKTEQTTPEKAEETPETKPETTSFETTTANDGNISINQTETKVEIKPADEVKAESTATETKAADSSSEITPEPSLSVPTTTESVVLKAEDLQPTEPAGNEKLQEQIESLTGEIQALEAKIERLTSGSTAPATEAAPTDKEPAIEKPAEMVKPEEKKAEPAPFSRTPAPATATAPTLIPVMPSVNSMPVNDIYGSTKKSTPSTNSTDDVEVSHTSGVAVISEVLVVLGTILFVILGITPFFREMIGEDLYQVISSVGWLTTAVTLLLGTLMAIFGKAKAAITLIGFIFVLLAAFMYIGMNYPSWLGPLEPILSSVFDFYN